MMQRARTGFLKWPPTWTLVGWAVCLPSTTVAAADVPSKIQVRRIWDAAPHNAFTDLIRFQNAWFCVFREGSAHVSPDGAIHVLSSTDGESWRSAARITMDGVDLRDPKVSITSDQRLMIIAAGATKDDQERTHHQTWVWRSSNGQDWGRPTPIGERDIWLWRVTPHGDATYGIGYDTQGEHFVRLYRSTDGVKFVNHVDRLFDKESPNESSLIFAPGGEALCLLRRDGQPGSGLLGRSQAPYTDWEWRELGARIGGPHWIQLPDGRFMAAVRLYDGRVRTSLAWIDVEQGRLTEFQELPSGGDTSYAGLVWHDGLLWVSYYSSHEGKTAIYLAKVTLPPVALPTQSNGEGSQPLESLFHPPPEYEHDFGPYRSPLRFDDGREVTSAEEWPARRREILAAWQRHLGPWPPLLEHPRWDILDTEARDGFNQHRVRVQIAPWECVEGWLLVPPGEGPLPAVLVPFYEPDTSVGLRGEHRDFAYQLVKRGFVSLSIGSPGGDARVPSLGEAQCQPLSYLAYVAANCHTMLARHPLVDPARIGVVGHSYGGKWAMFAACLYDKFACGAWSDPGIVWDERRPNVNYWEPWYLGRDPKITRTPGVVTPDNPRTGAYRDLVAEGMDLHELHALMAPRPFFVSGGSEDPSERWRALNHSVRVNELLGFQNRVGMSNRPNHDPNAASNAQLMAFFEYFLKPTRP